MAETRDLLQECLDRLAAGETPEAVLARYPEEREELAPLIRLAVAAGRVVPQPMPEAAKARVEQQIYGAARARQARRRFRPFAWLRAGSLASFRPGSFPRFQTSRWPAWAWRLVLIILVVLVIGSNGWLATAESGPGRPLFPLRMAVNEARVLLQPGPYELIALRLAMAEDRVADVRIMKQRLQLNEAAIFLMVGETENLMMALENFPHAADRSMLERALRLIQDERLLLRELVGLAPRERPRRNALLFLELSASWEPVVRQMLNTRP